MFLTLSTCIRHQMAVHMESCSVGHQDTFGPFRLSIRCHLDSYFDQTIGSLALVHPLTLYSIFLHKLFIAIISSQCLFSLPAHLFLSTSAFRCLEIIFLIYYYFLSL